MEIEESRIDIRHTQWKLEIQTTYNKTVTLQLLATILCQIGLYSYNLHDKNIPVSFKIDLQNVLIAVHEHGCTAAPTAHSKLPVIKRAVADIDFAEYPDKMRNPLSGRRKLEI